MIIILLAAKLYKERSFILLEGETGPEPVPLRGKHVREPSSRTTTDYHGTRPQ